VLERYVCGYFKDAWPTRETAGGGKGYRDKPKGAETTTNTPPVRKDDLSSRSRRNQTTNEEPHGSPDEMVEGVEGWKDWVVDGRVVMVVAWSQCEWMASWM